jgi:CRP-like cAMP-binding protein/HEAT repeat protein/ATP/ADP translocase
MSFIVLTGINWGETIVEADFLRQIGVQYLPWAFIINALCSILAIFIYSAFADRVSNDRIMIALLAISVIGIVIGLALLAAGAVLIAFPLFYLILNVPLLDIYNVHWATYVSSFYDTRAAKRVVPVLGTSARLAGIVAGLTIPLLNQHLAPTGIIGLWMAALVVMALVTWLMPHLLHENAALTAGHPAANHDAGMTMQPRPSAAENLREGSAYIRRSVFLRWMAVSTLLFTVLLALINFRTSSILLAELKTTTAMADFIGTVSGVANLLALPIQLFLVGRIIGWFGLGNANLIFPTGTLLISGSLIFFPRLGSAALGYFNRTTFRTAFRNSTENLLYNAVPLRVKGRARAFISGLIVPIGTILGGVILLLTPLLRATGASDLALPAAMAILAIAFVVVAVVIRRQYSQALLTLLEQEDYASLLLQHAGTLTSADPPTLARLRSKLASTADPTLALFLTQLLIEIGGVNAIPTVSDLIRQAPDAGQRAAFLNLLTTADLHHESVRQVFTACLSDGSGQVRQAALAGLENMLGARHSQYLSLASTRLSDEDLDVRAQVLPAVLASTDPALHTAAAAILDEMLNHPDSTQRVRGVQVIGQLATLAWLPALLSKLDDPVDDVRLQAILALEAMLPQSLPDDQSNRLFDALEGHTHDPVEQVRQVALSTLGRQFGEGSMSARACSVLLLGLQDDSANVQQGAVEALVGIGEAALPALQPLLKADQARQRKLAVIAAGRIAPQSWIPTVIAEINDSLAQACRFYRYWFALLNASAQHRQLRTSGMALLQATLREQADERLHEIFELLDAQYHTQGIQVVETALRAEDEHTRANAAEALESLTTPSLASLIATMCDPTAAPDRIIHLMEETLQQAPPSAAAALLSLRQRSTPEHNPWLDSLASFAISQLQPNALALLGSPSLLEQSEWTSAIQPEVTMLSLIERIIFLKEAPFFQEMTINQLKVLAPACEEQRFRTNDIIFQQGEPGGVLVVIVNGQVGIEQMRRQGSSIRLVTLDAHAYFGEITFFDNSPHTASAIALQETLVLRLRREPVIALMRRHPDLAMVIIKVLSIRLRETSQQVADLTRSRPRELHKLYDQFRQ